MERYAAGDESAFAEVYDTIAPRLHGFLRRRTRDDALAEDLMQQTFLQMHRARGQFFPGAQVAPWAFAIARRLLIDGARHRRHERAAAPPAGERREAIARDPAADDVLAARQAAGRMEAELERLPESHRVAFELLRCDGLSLIEAAQVLGTTVTAVKLRVHRAYKALRAAVGEAAGAPEGVD
jgi:RNA polymerase sigma-70 factor (ECF subfamily)